MTDLAVAVLDACDYVEDRRVPLPFKRRDPKEPGRREKELAEIELQRAMMRLFKAQAEKVKKWLEAEYPSRKQAVIPPIDLIWGEGQDADEGMNLLWLAIFLLLADAATNGIELFAAAQTIGLDYAVANAEAVEFLRTYTFDLFRPAINETTQKAVREAVTAFVETPGMTIGDVMKQLTTPKPDVRKWVPFGQTRAQAVSITEITRAYAEGDRIAGEALRAEFPDVRVIKTWYTNNDDRVCVICGPLHLAEVELEQVFEGGYDGPPAHVNCRCWRETTAELETDA